MIGYDGGEVVVSRTYVTGYEGNRLCDYVVEEKIVCECCDGAGEVDVEECLSLNCCPHGAEAVEECWQKCGDTVECPVCGGEGYEIRWR